jgi:hypothetical protein
MKRLMELIRTPMEVMERNNRERRAGVELDVDPHKVTMATLQ